ncbi:MAG: hypothetical protein K6B41_07990, partial [Butyrivibrio sp.]|nr:hypothetical protein [Butyrivibrio sp.]
QYDLVYLVLVLYHSYNKKMRSPFSLLKIFVPLLLLLFYIFTITQKKEVLSNFFFYNVPDAIRTHDLCVLVGSDFSLF